MAVFWACLAGLLRGQTLCPPDSCACLRRVAEQYARENNYVSAIRHYNAAIQCDPDQKQILNARIESLFLQIDSLRLAAEAQREKTRKTERQVAKAAAEAARAATAMQEQQKAAEKQQAEADSLLSIAEEAQKLAVQRRDSADAEARRTREALDRLQVVFGDLTDIFLQQAQEFIYQLEYDSALHRAQEAAYLGVPDRRPTLQRVQMEMTYIFHETGEKDLLAPLLDSLGLSDVQDVLQSLKMLDPLLFDTLEQRYYPFLLPVAGSTFKMGSKNGNRDERPVHEVTLSDFEMAHTETTWWQYALYCRSRNIDLPESPPWGRNGDHPVVNVSWNDAQGYLEWLNTRRTGTYRLPTEAEWEYAGRGGMEGRKDNYLYAGSNDLDEVGWYNENSGSTTKPVGLKNPNQLGLYDMSGNVWEWCADWYGNYSKKAQMNPTGPRDSWGRVLRGGSWVSNSSICRSAGRGRSNPGGRDFSSGFRVSRHFK